MIKRRKTTVFDEERDDVMEKTFLDLPESNLLSPREVANFLDISLRSVYRLYRQGAIQGIALNQCLRIRKNSLLQYIKDGIGK
jgi:excisionase family DNA binding protein